MADHLFLHGIIYHNRRSGKSRSYKVDVRTGPCNNTGQYVCYINGGHVVLRLASAFIDNIPYVATMNPLIVDMAKQLWPGLSGTQLLHHVDLMPVWWSLALGACLGGNGTAIGASANVIVVGMSEKLGKRISFGKFMFYGMPMMVMTVIISTVYVWLRYYVLKI